MTISTTGGKFPLIQSLPHEVVAPLQTFQQQVENHIGGLAISLASATMINTNASQGQFFAIALAHNATLANPTNATDGQLIVWRLKQTGGFTLAYGDKFRVLRPQTLPAIPNTAGEHLYVAVRYNQADDTFDFVEETARQAPLLMLKDNIGGGISNPLPVIPNPTDSPPSVDALRDDLVASVLQPIRDSISTLAANQRAIITRLRSEAIILPSVLPIDPLDAPGFLRYWEADDLSAGSVTSWASRGGGETMSGGVSPTAIAGALNGKKAVEFTSGQYLTFTELTNIRTVYIVVKHDMSTETNRNRFMPILGHGTATDWIGMEGTRLVGGASSSVTGGSAYLNGSPMAVATLSKAGTRYEVFAFVTTGNTTADRFASDRNAHFFTGRLAAIVLSSQAHSPTTVQGVSEFFIRDRALLTPKLLHVEGDSRTADRPTSGNGLYAGNSWPGQLIELMSSTNFGAFDVYNTAVGGQTLADMNADAVTEGNPLYNSAREENIATIWGGINDMGVSGGSQSGATTYSRLVTRANIARRGGASLIIGFTETHRNDLVNFPNQAALDACNAQIDIFNDNIRNNWPTFLDAMLDVLTLDYFNNSTGASGADSTADLADPNNTVFFENDKIHLKPKGLLSVATGYRDLLLSLL